MSNLFVSLGWVGVEEPECLIYSNLTVNGKCKLTPKEVAAELPPLLE